MIRTTITDFTVTKHYKLWLGLGAVILFAAGSYVGLKQYKRYKATLPRADAQHYLQVDNFKRAYDLHVPPAATGNQPVPLVIAFHGVGGNGSLMQQQTGFNQLADQGNVIVSYPDAINQHWNARPSDRPEAHNDVKFISALIEDIASRHNIDRTRIYATGFSNGGTFTHRVACEVDGITAIATVAAPIAGLLSEQCKPKRAISVLMIHGTNDDALPYNNPGKGLLSVPETMKFWSRQNQCQPQAIAQASGFPNIQLQLNRLCRTHTQVALYTIKGGAHEWAGSQAPTNHQSIRSFSASSVIWNFFQQQSAP